MKKNMARVMEKLEIDEGIKNLISLMWKHCYKTDFSCEGHRDRGYISFNEETGDGWFEKNAFKYGLSRSQPCLWCQYETGGYCSDCGAGLRGSVIYRGLLKSPIHT